jgi:Sec-independent protein translocase protein TatA
MEIFGIGPLELLLIVFIALIVLGPKDMMKTAQKAAAWLRKLRNSEIWSQTKEVMDIPNQVMHEAGLDKEIQELQNLTKKGVTGSVWSPPTVLTNPVEKLLEPGEEHKIMPEPAAKPAEDPSTKDPPIKDEQ